MDLLKKEIERKRKAIEFAKQSIVSSETNVSSGHHEEGVTESELNPMSQGTTRSTSHIDPNANGKGKNVGIQRSYMKVVQVRKIEESMKKTIPSDRVNHTQSATAFEDSNTACDSNSNHAHIPTNFTYHHYPSKKQTPTTETESSTETILSSEEISRQLREVGLPIWLFGEKTDAQRLRRLKEMRDKLTAMAAGLSEMDDFRLGCGHGIRNPFLGGKKADTTDEEITSDGYHSKPLTSFNSSTSHNFTNRHTEGAFEKTKTNHENSYSHDSHSTPNEFDPTPVEHGAYSTQDHVDEKNLDNDPHKKIHHFFKSLLRQWEEELALRPESMKRTAAGKNETKTLKQCKDYIRPLFKLCKTRTLEDNMMGHILNIVNFCIEGEFVKANDAYLDVSIGRAAWPIGVTMVGIHARSGRARIESANVAHVMNSEMQRKYLTSIKRLMSYCQNKRPDVPPSKKVINM